MDSVRTKLDWRVARGFLVIFKNAFLELACICLIAVASAPAQVEVPVRESDSSTRLLSLEEGRSIVSSAWQQDQPEAGMHDCSHLVHQIYANAGFEYPYASSFEIYAGNENFERVRNPHPGDLIAWRGHVGIVVDPLDHSFYSLVRTGLEAQDYRSAYWRSRGIPRFYRFRVELGGIVNTANTAGTSRITNSHRQRSVGADVGITGEEPIVGAITSSNWPQTAVSEKAEAIYGPPPPLVAPVSKNAGARSVIPASVIISTGSRPPTREEVAEGISELSDAVGSVLQTDDPLNVPLPVMIVEQFRVERVDVKRDHGWARLAIDSKMLIDGGTAKVKQRHEKVRWELRRTESGWEAVKPQDRTYVPQDVAVKNLADQLARLTSSDGAVEHQSAVLRQESRLASLLNKLLESKQDR